MTQKPPPSGSNPKDTPPLADNIKDSAQQIWLAGLGAFTKAQEEGSKVFDALVKEGMTMQRKTQAATEEKLAEATQKMTHMASEISAKATGQWGKLESIFEERVAKALGQLGVPTAQQVQDLTARVEALSQELEALKAATGNKTLRK
jgi:poly(hydroxyalkanoate) granule-associated protein